MKSVIGNWVILGFVHEQEVSESGLKGYTARQTILEGSVFYRSTTSFAIVAAATTVAPSPLTVCGTRIGTECVIGELMHDLFLLSSTMMRTPRLCSSDSLSSPSLSGALETPPSTPLPRISPTMMVEDGVALWFLPRHMFQEGNSLPT